MKYRGVFMSFASILAGICLSMISSKGEKEDNVNAFRFIVIMLLLWVLDKLNIIISSMG